MADARAKKVSVAQAAMGLGMEPERAEILELLLDDMGLAPLALDQAQRNLTAKAERLSEQAQVARSKGQYAKAAELYGNSARSFALAVGDLHPETIVARANQGNALREAGRYQEAATLQQSALKEAENVLGDNHPNIGALLNNLAVLYGTRGWHDKEEPLLLRSLAINEAHYGADHIDNASTLSNLAGNYEERGDLEEADSFYLRAQIIAKKNPGNEPLVAVILNNRGHLHATLGDYGKAELLYQEALKVQEEVLAPGHPDLARTLGNLGTLYFERGDYALAVQKLLVARAIEEKSLGPSHPGLATTLSNLAEAHEAIGRYEEAERLYVQSLGIRKKVLKPRHPAVARSLVKLAGIYALKGSYKQAESAYLEALSIQANGSGSQAEAEAEARTLNGLGALYCEMGDLERADKHLSQALAILETNMGGDTKLYLSILGNIALTHKASGRLDKAEEAATRSLETETELLGEGHPSVATGMSNLGTIYEDMGRYKDAEGCHRRALSIQEAALGPRHPEVATTLGNLASVLRTRGAYEEAMALNLRALKIREDALGPEHPSVGTSLSNLGGLYEDMGLYEQALPLYRRALVIKREALGQEHVEVGIVLNNLAGLFHAMGRHGDAEAGYRAALEVYKATLGVNHPKVATVVDSLGLLLYDSGAHDTAGSLYREAKRLRIRSLGDRHPSVAFSLNNMGSLYLDSGRLEAARLAYTESLGILMDAHGSKHPLVAAVLHNMSFVDIAEGSYSTAAQRLESAASIRSQFLPHHHPDLTRSADNLGLVLLRLGRDAQAHYWLKISEQAAHTHFLATSDLSESDADLFALHQRQRSRFATAVSNYAPEDGFGAALRWQGGALTAEMLWRDLREIERAEGQQTVQSRRFEALRQAAAKYLRLRRATPKGPEQKAAFQALAAEARVSMDDAEAALIEDHPHLAERRALPDVQPADVCRALHARGGVPLLDYVQHQRVDPDVKGIELVPHLLAFVVEPIAAAGGDTPACRYHRVDLGPSKPVAEIYSRWRKAVGEAEACFGEHGRPEDCKAAFAAMDHKGAALRACAWDPVVGRDGGVPWLARQRRIFVVPDGPLAGVSLGALPASEGGYLVEDHEFTVFSFPAAVTLPEPSLSDLKEHDRGALVVGDVNYEWEVVPSKASQYVRHCLAEGCQKVGSEDRQGIDTALDRRTEEAKVEIPELDPLSGTGCGPEYAGWSKLTSESDAESQNDADGHEVSRLDRLAMDVARALGKPSEVIVGQMASEHLVTARIPGRPIIHLQTHGYSITDMACAERHARIKPRRLPGASPLLAGFQSDETAFDPHRLSGLIFAARNTHAADQKTERKIDSPLQSEPTEDHNDGLLRARDVLNLNLRKTWLVVLAACQTGLGEQFAGEGALGVGRAFLVAGARYAVVSQWQVPFHATSRMFTAFYGHVVAGVAPPAALRKAQVAVIAELRGAGIHHSAFIWGAFSPLVGYGESDGDGHSK